MADLTHRQRAQYATEDATRCLKVGALESAEQQLRTALFELRQAQIECTLVHTEGV